MINKETGRLKIFENFLTIQRKVENNNTWSNSNSFFLNTASSNIGSNVNVDTLIQKIRFDSSDKHSFKEWLFSPIRFFKNIKKNVKSLTYEQHMRQILSLNELMEEAKQSHQTALVDLLNDEKIRIDKEILILDTGIDKFLDEADVIKFAKYSNRTVKLDWIANFIRIIPKDIVQKLLFVEEKKLFDNYVIMHYDPNDLGSELTKAQKEKKKDPILFGVLSCSNRLYFIGDWIDEYCDLTLTKVLKELKIDEKKLNIHKIINHQTPKVNK